MHRIPPRAAILALLIALAACGGGGGATSGPVTPPVTPPPPPAAGPYPTGLSDQSLAVGGTARQFRVHVPATLSGAPKALVFVLHGGGGTGLGVADTGAHPLSVFRTVADREGFVVVYPGGLPATDGQDGWVDCRADNGVSSGADDIGFLAALIERVRGQYGLATTRVFMAGGSNGAMMTQAFAIARPDLVAAVASSGGSLAANPRAGACAAGPTTPKPILLAHGTADTQMPYDGGCVANLGGNCNRGQVISAQATRDRWLQVNGLAGVTPTQQVVDLDASDGGPANRFDHAGSTPLRWWRLDGAGHTVASRTVLVQPNATTGIQNRDIEFAEVAWAFFNERLSGATVPSSERQINATATDPAITAEPAAGEVPHVAINPSPSVNPRGKLFVFLPGTQGRTTQTVHILRAAATRGFHAIGLNYPNPTAMGTLCGTSADPECYWKARSAVVLGTGTTVPGQTPVARADSVVNRLAKILAWLRSNQPAENWGQYLLADGSVDWSKVVVSGHSQGGGHAGVLAKSFALSRACYFSSPADWNETTDRPDGWTASKPNATPAARQYGFGSDSDTLVPNARASAHWDAFGLSRPASGPLLVDGGTPPFAGSQQLRTALPPNPASAGVSTVLRNHGLTVVDALTPVDADGKPLFDTNGVWAYLCFQ
jgi:polyhydroxybutyrate depolymerase